MTRLFLLLLTLLFSLSGPAMGGYSDFDCSSLAANSGGRVYSGAFHPQSGNGIMRPSSYKSPLPEGWVPAKGGHATVGTELMKEQGVLLDDLQGFTAFDRGKYWEVEFKSALNSPDFIPGTVLPNNLRSPILETIERNTGKPAIGTTNH